MAKKEKIIPTYSTPLQEKFVNYIMRRGKKLVARKIFEEALQIIADKGKKDAYKVFEKAIENASPIIEVRPKRVGGAVYQVPTEVPAKRQLFLACSWILKGARGAKGTHMAQKLATELMQAAEGTGAAVKKKEEVHKMAEANKAFAFMARY
jgi:small subunit ribosomal protein S7